jgi:hypothetical protein
MVPHAIELVSVLEPALLHPQPPRQLFTNFTFSPCRLLALQHLPPQRVRCLLAGFLQQGSATEGKAAPSATASRTKRRGPCMPLNPLRILP